MFDWSSHECTYFCSDDAGMPWPCSLSHGSLP